MTQERKAFSINGWAALTVHLIVTALTINWFWSSISELTKGGANLPAISQQASTIPIQFILSVVVLVVLTRGYFMLYPNTAKVMTLLGSYAGTVRSTGFLWTVPFYKMYWTSLRLQSLQGPILKVNDKQGNPIEISTITIFHVQDTAQARFDVHNFQEYVQIQSESSVRHVASNYAYDHDDGDEMTLRASVDEVSQALQAELQERLSKAGIQVDEARITHLAYAPEIALAMLRRQQAAAVIGARRQIVEGAVSIVDAALTELSAKNVVELDNERKAAMVSNLLVVLCSESQVQPIVNTGTLYT
jgi:regulator of protease activity HflC (stomatin/prohibitin superfamily)